MMLMQFHTVHITRRLSDGCIDICLQNPIPMKYFDIMEGLKIGQNVGRLDQPRVPPRPYMPTPTKQIN
jgi:hypothetical protein